MELLRQKTGKVLIEGHRGAEGLGVENSWQAIERGFEAGADSLELDIQISQDGTLVLFNDYMFPDGRWISDVPSQEITKIEVLGQKIVFLSDVLDWVKKRNVYLSLDIKNGFGFGYEIFEKTLFLVEENHLVDKVMFLSWDHNHLLELKKRNSQIVTRALVRAYPVNFVGVIQAAKVDAVNLSRDLATVEIVHSFQEAGIAVFMGMTFRPEYSLANKWELDGISCQNPKTARIAIENP